jgi:hypothetical protein
MGSSSVTFKAHIAMRVQNAYAWVQSALSQNNKVRWAKELKEASKVPVPKEFEAEYKQLLAEKKTLLKTRVDEKLSHMEMFGKNMAFAAKVFKDDREMLRIIERASLMHKKYVAELRKAAQLV